MKTTIEITDQLLRTAKKYAAERGVSLRAVIESGLRLVVEKNRRPLSFVLKDRSVSGTGTSPEFPEGEWSTVRDEIYKGRGG